MSVWIGSLCMMHVCVMSYHDVFCEYIWIFHGGRERKKENKLSREEQVKKIKEWKIDEI